MGKTFNRVFWASVGTIAAWAVAIKPRTKGKPDMTVFSAYDYANGGLHDFCREVPDNTIKAYDKALKHGYGIIMDVRLTKDGIPVAFTDHELWRLCGIEGTVEDMTFDEIAQIKLAETEYTAPALKEALEFVDGQVPVLLNLRTYGDNYESLAEAAAAVIEQYDGIIAVESMDYRCVRWFTRNLPHIIRGQMFEKNIDFGNTVITFLRQFAKNWLLTNCLTKPDFISSHVVDSRSLSLRFCKLLYHVPVMHWNVKTMKEYEKARMNDAIVSFEDIKP